MNKTNRTSINRSIKHSHSARTPAYLEAQFFGDTENAVIAVAKPRNIALVVLLTEAQTVERREPAACADLLAVDQQPYAFTAGLLD